MAETMKTLKKKSGHLYWRRLYLFLIVSQIQGRGTNAYSQLAVSGEEKSALRQSLPAQIKTLNVTSPFCLAEFEPILKLIPRKFAQLGSILTADFNIF